MIKVTELSKIFRTEEIETTALNGVSFEIKKGEFVTIVGHSGCGKSTLLKIICGLVSYQDGDVSRNGHPVTEPDAACGMVFQDHRLLPWLKIKDNRGISNETQQDFCTSFSRNTQLWYGGLRQCNFI